MAAFANIIELVDLYKEGPFVIASLEETVSAEEKIHYSSVLVGIITEHKHVRDKFDLFRERVNIKYIKCINVVKITDELNFVKLEHLNRDLAEFLLGMGFGHEVEEHEQRNLALEYFKIKQQYEQLPPEPAPCHPIIHPTTMPTSTVNGGAQKTDALTILDSEKDDKRVPLKPGMKIIGCIINVAKFPELHVQLSHETDLFNHMMLDINANDTYLPPFKGNPLEGNFCAVSLDVTTLQCRGIISKILSPKTCSVHFIDYACERVKKFEEMKRLPKKFEIYLPFAHTMIIDTADTDRLPESVYKKLQEDFIGKPIQIDIIGWNRADLKFIINALYKGVNLKQIARQLINATTKYRDLVLNPGNQYNIVISWIDTSGKLPWSFYAQLEDQIPLLETLMRNIEVECTTKPTPPLESVFLGMPIIATFKNDGLWYRAKVTEATETTATVQYIDYGNSDVIPWSNTRRIGDDFVSSLPCQALQCRLVSADTVATAAIKFEEKYSDQSFSMKITKQLDTGELLVKLFDINKNPGMDISSTLLQFPGQNVPRSMTPRALDVSIAEAPIPPIPDHAKPIREALLNSDPDWVRQANIGVDSPGLPEQRTDPKLKGQKCGKFSNLVEALEERVAMSKKSNQYKRDDWGSSSTAQEDWGDGHPASYLSREVWDSQDHASSTKSEAMGRYSQAANPTKPQKCGVDQDRWQHDKYFELEREFDLRDQKQKQDQNHDGHFNKSYKHDKPPNVASSSGTSSQATTPSYHKKGVLNEVFAIPKPKLRFRPLRLSPGMTKVKATATYIKSPWEFSVQVHDSHSELSTMAKRIAVLCKHGGIALNMSPNELDPGDACLGKFVDNKWYRAQVIEVIDDNVKLQFIDTGHISTVNIHSQVKTAAMELLELTAQSFDCFLRGTVPRDGEQWSRDEIKNFQSIISRAELELDLISVDVDGLYNVVIYDDSMCINTQFGASIDSLAARKEIAKITLHNMLPTDEAIILWFITPANFYVRLASRVDHEEKVFRSIQDIADKCPVLHKVEKDNLVLARFPQDSNFYRGVVLATKDVHAKVFRVDVGDSKVCETSKLRAMPETLMSVPGFAVHCSMADIKPTLGSDWPLRMPEIDHVFQAQETFLLTPVSCDDTGKIRVHLTSLDKTYRVADELIKKGVAKREELPEEKNSLLPGCSCNVVVSCSEGLRFCVYPSSKIPELDKLQIDLQALRLEDAENETRPGKIGAAKNTDNGQWYRVLALGSATTAGTKVIAVDYGNISIPRCIKKLPEELANVPVFAMECKLAIKPVENKEAFYKEVLEIYENFVLEENEREVTVCVYDKTSTDVLIVDLLSPGKESLIDVLVEARLVERTYSEAYICYAISPTKFYIHETRIEEKLQKVEGLLSTEDLCDIGKLEVGVKCVAKFEDDNAYYRAKVISIIDTSIKVFFYDYGNTAIVSDIKALPLHLAVIGDLAKECSLSPVVTSDEVVTEFTSKALDGTIIYQVQLHDTNSTPWKVSLLKNGEQLFQVEDKPAPHGSTVNVIVSHFVACDDFWVQKMRDEEALVELQVVLMELQTELLSFVHEGQICAGKYKANNTWYRVRILDQEIVQFIDYGHTGEAISFKELTEELMKLPPFATHCQLSINKLIHHEICEVEKVLKQQLTVFQADFKEVRFNKSTVVLYKDGKNIIDLSSQQRCDISGINLTDFVVSNYCSCAEFYIQLCKNVEKMDHLCSCLSDENFFDILDKVEEGMLCLTKYSETDAWHRCLVTNMSTSSATVFLIDYGIAIHDATLFRRIPESMIKIPSMAFLCHLLNGPPPTQPTLVNKLAKILDDPRRPVFQTDCLSEHFGEGIIGGINVFVNGVNVLRLIQDDVKETSCEELESMRLGNYLENIANEHLVDTLDYMQSVSSSDEVSDTESIDKSSQESVHTRSDGTQSDQENSKSSSIDNNSVSTENSETLSAEETNSIEVATQNEDIECDEGEGADNEAASSPAGSIFVSDEEEEEYFDSDSETQEPDPETTNEALCRIPEVEDDIKPEEDSQVVRMLRRLSEAGLEVQPKCEISDTQSEVKVVDETSGEASGVTGNTINREKMSVFAYITQNIEQASEAEIMDKKTSMGEEDIEEKLQEEPAKSTVQQASNAEIMDEKTSLREEDNEEKLQEEPAKSTVEEAKSAVEQASEADIMDEKTSLREKLQEEPAKKSTVTPDICSGNSTPSAIPVERSPQSVCTATPKRKSLIPLRTSARTPLPKIRKEENKEQFTTKSTSKTERKSVIETLLQNSPQSKK